MPHGGHRPSPGRQVRPRRPDRRGRAPGRASKASTSPRTPPACSRSSGDEGLWSWPEGYAQAAATPTLRGRGRRLRREAQHPARARPRSARGPPWCRPRPRAEEILARKPDGVLLSNGPGDPAATGEYAVPEIQQAGRQRQAGVRHLPRPPDAGAGAGRQDHEDGAGPPRREPSGEGPDHRQGRDRLDEPRLHRRPRQPARRR